MHLHTNRPRLASSNTSPFFETGQTLPIDTGWPDRPSLRFKELLNLLQVSRSKAYELKKTDPDFPKGVPLYDSERSPKFYWTHEAIAWLEGRANKFRDRQKES